LTTEKAAAAPPSLLYRLRKVLREGLRAGLKSCLFLLKIAVPVSLAVSLLNYTGVLALLAGLINPLMTLLGLRGEAALVIVTSILLNNYSAIAVVQTLEFSGREVTILAVMCLIAHNMLVETAVMKTIGSSVWKMAILRIGTAIAAAFLLNLLLPDAIDVNYSAVTVGGRVAFGPYLYSWLVATAGLVLKIVVFVFAIMILQRLLEEFRITYFLSRLFAPLMRLFGLSRESSFLWIVINTIGYAYGAAVIMDQVKGGAMRPQEADLFNHHAAISHSLLEDSLLWWAIGVPLFWLVIPRVVLAVVVVWLERLRRHLFKSSFRVGTV